MWQSLNTGDGQDEKHHPTGWDRVWAGLFAFFVLLGDYQLPRAVTLALHAVGWLVILAAAGVVELLMGLYYRYRYSRARSRTM